MYTSMAEGGVRGMARTWGWMCAGGGMERRWELEEMAVELEACEGGRLVAVGRNIVYRRSAWRERRHQYRP